MEKIKETNIVPAALRTNVIYCGDCLTRMKRYIPDESIDLIYLDPPFFSEKNYENFWIKNKSYKFKFSDRDWEKFKGKINPQILEECKHIGERWRGGKKGIWVYIAYMKERLIQCERVLKPTGSIYLHCDWHAGHYLKVMMDEVFGYDNFLNEIIWWYHDPAGTVHDRFKKKHDTILYYAKNFGNHKFNSDAVRTPYSEGTLQQEAAGTTSFGRIVQCNRLGKVREDVWEIPFINSQAKERLGYPTQKPEALLELIIKASSEVDDIVLDPFCGCGTTLNVCSRLNRKYIGIDISHTGCTVTRKRIKINRPQIIGGESIKRLKKMNPYEFAQLMIVEKLKGIINSTKTGDMGIDGWLDFKTVPVQVKRWGHKVGRPEVDKFRTAIERDGKKKGVIIAFNFTKDAYAESKRGKSVEIELKEVKDIMKQARLSGCE